MVRLVVLLVLFLSQIGGANAHVKHHTHHSHHHLSSNHSQHHRFRHHYQDGRPSAWCGWWMRHNNPSHQDPGTEYNLARNWEHWGTRADGPSPGVIGVLPHHVFLVMEVKGDGKVLAISGNDGHTVRTRIRSTKGVIAWRR
jgi:hypothetical protein